MTDLRYLGNHREKETADWKDLLVGIFMMLVICCLFWFFWQTCPGAKTVDDVLQIQAPGRCCVETFVAGEDL